MVPTRQHYIFMNSLHKVHKVNSRSVQLAYFVCDATVLMSIKLNFDCTLVVWRFAFLSVFVRYNSLVVGLLNVKPYTNCIVIISQWLIQNITHDIKWAIVSNKAHDVCVICADISNKEQRHPFNVCLKLYNAGQRDLISADFKCTCS
jgi:hypothetical protein